MKKTLSVILAVILMFSTVSVMAFAEETATEDNLVSVNFYIDVEDIEENKIYYSLEVLPGVIFVDRLQKETTKLETPTKESTETTKYTFRYWKKYENRNGEWVATGETCDTGNVPAVPKGTAGDVEIFYVAEFVEKDIKATQSLWAFIQSIFKRINWIFEYIAKVFEGVIEF